MSARRTISATECLSLEPPSGNHAPTERAETAMSEILESIARLTRDIKNASITLSDDGTRFLAQGYYAMKQDRIRAAHQERALAKGGEPHDVMSWLTDQRELL